MKVIAIGDIHGRRNWKDIVQKEQPDFFVFIGDYFDTHENITVPEQLGNFLDILYLAKESETPVILLIGNHDFHYISEVRERYSGFQSEYAGQIERRIKEALAEGMLQIVFEADGVIYSHAGITKTWLENTGPLLLSAPVTDNVGKLFEERTEVFKFTPGENSSPYGDDITQGPLWVRPESLKRDSIDGKRQVVGHTQHGRIVLDKHLAFIDALGQGEYLEVMDGDFKILKI